MRKQWDLNVNGSKSETSRWKVGLRSRTKDNREHTLAVRLHARLVVYGHDRANGYGFRFSENPGPHEGGGRTVKCE